MCPWCVLVLRPLSWDRLTCVTASLLWRWFTWRSGTVSTAAWRLSAVFISIMTHAAKNEDLHLPSLCSLYAVSSVPRVIKHCRRSGMVTMSTSLRRSEFWVFYGLTVTSCYISAANIQSGFTFEFHRITAQLFILYCNSYFILHAGEAHPSEAGQLTMSADTKL